MVGVTNSTTTDLGGGSLVGGFEANDMINYSVKIPSATTYTVNYRVMSPVSGGSFPA